MESNKSGKGKLVYFNIKDESREWEFANNGTDNFSKWVKDKIREFIGINDEIEVKELSENIREEIKTQIKEALKSQNIQSISVETKNLEEDLIEVVHKQNNNKPKINKFMDDICQSSDD